MTLWVIGYLAATAALCGFVFHLYYHSDLGPRPWVATGCTTLILVGCLLGGFWLLVIWAIGGSFGF